jgi:SAM-dependent methyltransferase
VWATAQQAAPSQRRGRYLPESTQHPARMLPAVAAHAVAAYTDPADLVLDPMCGIGTTLVEAAHLGRDAVGVEFETRWADIAAANLALAHDQGATGRAMVVRGDATRLAELIPAAVRGRVALVVTSPPYGPAVHGHVRPTPAGVVKSANRYSDAPDPANLAHRDWPGLLDGFTRILAGCAALLRPGGTVVVTARPWRKHGELVDLPSAVLAAGAAAGLVPVERCVALLAAVRGGRLVPRPSFFQLQQIRRARAAGIPLHLIAHEDVLVLRNDPKCPGSGKLKVHQREPEGHRRPGPAAGRRTYGGAVSDDAGDRGPGAEPGGPAWPGVA